jgi:ribonuclease-3
MPAMEESRAHKEALSDFEVRLGHRFVDRKLLERALSHRSYAHEAGRQENYERLEFLGDAVLALVVAETLFRQRPDLPEGDLSKLKSLVVSARSLARYARRLELGRLLKLGIGEERSGGRRKPSLLADSLEAVLGAVFLDGGLEAVREPVGRLLQEILDGPSRRRVDDPKTRLQELAQARGWELPEYRPVAADGPDHEKRFTVECVVQGEAAGRGEGSSKKRAEQAAAAEALELLDPAPADP